MDAAGVSPDEIDFLIIGTTTPDLVFPNVACLIQEELGIAVDVSGAPLVFENIFEYRGEPGHEIVFLYPVTFPAGALAGKEVLHYLEDNGETCVARWFPLTTLDLPTGPALFPDGLKDRLTSFCPNKDSR